MEYLRRRKNAFVFAFQGLGSSLKNEPHMRIHLAAALLVVIAAWHFGVTRHEWAQLILCIAAVIAAELFNTAVEKLCDLVKPEPHPVVKYIKDISSAAVLLVCAAAAVTGALVFGPRIWSIP
jgi:diacylglycerol kinase (ATP)